MSMKLREIPLSEMTDDELFSEYHYEPCVTFPLLMEVIPVGTEWTPKLREEQMKLRKEQQEYYKYRNEVSAAFFKRFYGSLKLADLNLNKCLDCREYRNEVSSAFFKRFYESLKLADLNLNKCLDCRVVGVNKQGVLVGKEDRNETRS